MLCFPLLSYSLFSLTFPFKIAKYEKAYSLKIQTICFYRYTFITFSSEGMALLSAFSKNIFIDILFSLTLHLEFLIFALSLYSNHWARPS